MQNRLIAAILWGLVAGACWAGVEKVDKAEESAWLNYTLPCPHEITISAKNILAANDIGFRLPPTAGDIESNAVAELKRYIREKTGTEPNGKQFEVIAGVLDKDGKVGGIAVASAVRLSGLPNRDQAYLIEPAGDSKLIVAALYPQGVFYGIQTLRQLLGRKADSKAIAVPLAHVVDWPDLAERGTWCGSIDNESIIWYSAFKLNFRDYNSEFTTYGGNPAFEWKDGKPVFKYRRDAQTEEDATVARRHAFNSLATVSHFNFGWWNIFYKKYCPELLGAGPGALQTVAGVPANNKTGRCPCASNPRFEEILTAMMEAAAAAGAKEQIFWTTEFWGQCGCDKCKNTNQFVLETRAMIRAWRRVQERYPDYKIRWFSSISKVHANGELCRELPEDTFDKVAKELPPDVGVGRACFQEKSKDGKCIDPPFDDLVAKGNRLYSYRAPTLGAMPAVEGYKKFFQDLLELKYSGGYAFQLMPESGINSESYAAFQLAAIAEWSWNNQKRGLREFAVAWATVNGYESPEKFGDFIVQMQPFCHLWSPYNRFFNNQVKCFKTSCAGQSEWPYGAEKELNSKLASCDAALTLAKQTGNPGWILAAETTLTLVRINSYAGELARLVRAKGGKVELETAYGNFNKAVADMEVIFKRRAELYSKVNTPRFNEDAREYLKKFAKLVDDTVKPLLN